MKIDVIKHDSLDSLQLPWRISRPGQSDQSTEDILFDAQLLEFCHATIKLDVPILIRDVVCGYRDHIVWAQTSRVKDPADGFFADHFTPPHMADAILNAMKSHRDQGVAQDSYRTLLPVDAYTTFTCKLSARRVAKMYKWCKNSGIEMLEEFADLLLEAFNTTWGLSLLADKVGYEEPWPMIDENERYEIDNLTISYALFAQLIRHRNLEVHSNLIELVSDLNHSAGQTLQLKHGIQVSIRSSKHFLKDVAAKRNCWIAQGDLWKPLIGEINRKVGFRLPCDKTSCPFSADNISRCRGEDPNPPCPIFLLQDKTPLGQTLRDELSTYNRQRGQSVDFWDGVIRSAS